jgi:hypothetical protein
MRESLLIVPAGINGVSATITAKFSVEALGGTIDRCYAARWGAAVCK